MPVLTFGQIMKQFVPLLQASVCSRAGCCPVSLIDDDELRLVLKEVGAVRVRLGVIDAHDDVLIEAENAVIGGREIPF